MVTLFLTQIWGPVLLAVGLGFFVSPKYYAKIYRDLETSPFAVLFFGMFATALGMMQVLVHNTWGSLPQAIVSLLGWGLLGKGLICTIMPGLADKWADWAVNSKLLPIAGTGTLILGLYLSWLGFTA